MMGVVWFAVFTFRLLHVCYSSGICFSTVRPKIRYEHKRLGKIRYFIKSVLYSWAIWKSIVDNTTFSWCITVLKLSLTISLDSFTWRLRGGAGIETKIKSPLGVKSLDIEKKKKTANRPVYTYRGTQTGRRVRDAEESRVHDKLYYQIDKPTDNRLAFFIH